MRRVLATPTIVAGALFFGTLTTAHAGPTPTTTITETWSFNSANATHITGSLPTLTTSPTYDSNTNSTITGVNPLTVTLTENVVSSNAWIFSAKPNNASGTSKADLPIVFTLTDGGGGTATFTAWINYYANATTQIDDLAWSTTAAATPGFLASGSLAVPVTLSDGTQITVNLPYETDWNIAQGISFDFTGGGPTINPLLPAPEPSTIAVLAFGLLGTIAAARRQTRSR